MAHSTANATDLGTGARSSRGISGVTAATAPLAPPATPRRFTIAESMLPAVMEATADGVFVADSASRSILVTNGAMCKMLGYRAEELASLDFEALLAPADRAAGLLKFNALRTGILGTPVDVTLVRKNGSTVDASLAGAPLSADGSAFVVGVLRDMSPQHRAEASLRASEQKLRTIFDSVSDGIIVHDMETGAFAEVNPRICELLGYTREQMLALDVSAFTADPSPVNMARSAEYTRRAAAGEPVTFEWQARTQGGELIWLEVGLRRVTLGDRDFLLSTAHNITERKRAADGLSYRDRLLHATMLGTAELVAADSFDAGMLQALKIVGEALGVDRALVIADHDPGSPPALRFAWERPGVRVSIKQRDLGDHPVEQAVISAWLEPLRAGEQVITHLQEAPEPLRKLLALLENQSMLLVPIFVDGSYWGNIGLDSCRARRDWNVHDSEILRTFASVIGIAILRHRIHRSLQKSQTQLSQALDMARAGGWEYDMDSGLFTFNDNFYRVYGTTAEAVGGYRMSAAEYARRFLRPEDAGLVESEIKASLESTDPSLSQEFEHRMRYADGTSGYVVVRLFVVKDEQGRTIRAYGVNQDVTERKRAEEALRRANRALLTLSVGSESLVRAQREADFLDAMCRALVDVGGYAAAWIGFPEPDKAREMRPAAIHGAQREVFEQEGMTWEDIEEAQGPVGVVIRTGRAEINSNFASNPKVSRWREAARRQGWGSHMALPLSDRSDVFGVLAIYSRETDAFSDEEVRLLTQFSNDLSFGIVSLRTRGAREEAVARLRKAMTSTVQALASTLERRDPYTAGHQRAVARLAVAIGRKLGLTEEELDGIHLAATIHDIGKIEVPSEILSKPGKLTSLEYQIVQGHAQAGYEIVKGVDFPWPIAEMILQHHERLDGSGYPRGLIGSEILPGAKILAVADVVESMMAHRPYRAALGLQQALNEIEIGRDLRYDAAAVDACTALLRNEGFKP